MQDDIDARFESLLLDDYIPPRPAKTAPVPASTNSHTSSHSTHTERVEIVHVDAPKPVPVVAEPKEPRKNVDSPKKRTPTFDVKELFDIFREKIRSLDPKNPNSHNGLVCIGNPGNGKTWTVIDVLKNDFGLTEDEGFKVVKGSSTVVSIYKVLHDYRSKGKIVVLDDVDSIFEDDKGKNIFKAALDTSPIRKISYLSKTNFDPKLAEKLRDELLAAGKLPNEFDFQGKVIFLSNLEERRFGAAIIDRSEFMDLYLTARQVVEIARELKPKLGSDILVDVSDEVKSNVIDFYESLYRDDLDTFDHKISLRAIVNGCKTAMLIPDNWKKSILIKERLTEKLHLLTDKIS